MPHDGKRKNIVREAIYHAHIYIGRFLEIKTVVFVYFNTLTIPLCKRKYPYTLIALWDFRFGLEIHILCKQSQLDLLLSI